MEEKIGIIKDKESNVLHSIIDYLDMEKISYYLLDNVEDMPNDIQKIVYIDSGKDISKILSNKKFSLLIISSQRKVFNAKARINYIITNLLSDDKIYNDVQKEYLYKKGIYHIFREKLGELLENVNNYDGMIYDLTALKMASDSYVFSFESINETYNWLSKKNKLLPNNFVRKVINFYSSKVYDDSLREINYLTEKLTEIKEGKKVIDIFICDKEELKFFEKNYFFCLLLKNISSTYKLYLIDKNKLWQEDSALANKLLDGVAIYDDCIYKDTYDDEFSLGYVDCNKETIKEYNEYFDYILNKYATEIKAESDLNEF